MPTLPPRMVQTCARVQFHPQAPNIHPENNISFLFLVSGDLCRHSFMNRIKVNERMEPCCVGLSNPLARANLAANVLQSQHTTSYAKAFYD